MRVADAAHCSFSCTRNGMSGGTSSRSRRRMPAAAESSSPQMTPQKPLHSSGVTTSSTLRRHPIRLLEGDLEALRARSGLCPCVQVGDKSLPSRRVSALTEPGSAPSIHPCAAWLLP